MQEKKSFVVYEYKEITVPARQVSMYLDCYENFGWEPDEKVFSAEKQKANAGQHHVNIQLKRDRKIINKMELTRLQRNFEACAHEIDVLEKAKTQAPTVWALVTGILGTAFMAGSTFAVVHEPPMIWLCILLAVPGFIGWIVPYFLYRRMVAKEEKKYDAMIEEKWEEIYRICEKGHALF